MQAAISNAKITKYITMAAHRNAREKFSYFLACFLLEIFFPA